LVGGVAFETYLSDTHARPPLATALGYVASLALHGPPLALFISTWLTYSLLIGYSGPTATHVRMVPAYQIPVSMTTTGAGLARGEGLGAAGGGNAQRRRGLRGRTGRAGRRGLVVPQAVKPLPEAGTAETNAFLAWLDAPDGLIGIGSSDGDGAGRTGDGAGEGGTGPNDGAGGKDSAGSGGGGSAEIEGNPPKVVVAMVKPSRPPSPPRGRSESGAGNDKAPTGEVSEEDDVVAAPAPGRPYKASYLSETLAAYYRTYEDYPKMPESFWYGGVTSYLLAVEVCVSTEGAVSNVIFQQRANEDVDRLVGDAIKSWRYRPRIVGGSPRPFCHPMKIEYTRAWRSFGR
jgi:hypothetical protein